MKTLLFYFFRKCFNTSTFLSGACLTFLLTCFAAELNPIPSWLSLLVGALWTLWFVMLLNSSLFDKNVRRCDWTSFLLLCAVGVFLLWRGPPSEPLYGITDEAYNYGTAKRLSKDGQPAISVSMPSDSTFAKRLINERPTQAQRAASPESVGERRPANGPLFFDAYHGESTLRSVFPTGFPLVAASMTKLGGERILFYANTLLLFASACSFFLLARQLASSPLALLGSLLFLFFPLHFWLSATGFAELLLVFLALECLRALIQKRYGIAIVIAAVSPLVKVDAWWLVVLLLAFLPFFVKRLRDLTRLGLTFAFLVGVLIVTLSLSGSGYMLDTIASLLREPFVWTASILGIGLMGLAYYTYRSRGWSRHQTQIVQVAILAFVGTSFVFFLFVRPSMGGEDSFYYWPLQREILSYREFSLPRLAWYFSLPGLIFALGALLYLPISRVTDCKVLWFLFLLATIPLLLFAWDIRNNPIQPYAMRRFVPFVTPILLLALLLSAHGLMERWRKIPRISPPLGLIALLLYFVTFNQKWTRDWNQEGIAKQLTYIADLLPSNAVVLAPFTSGVVDWVPALTLYSGIQTWTIPEDWYRDAEFRQALREWQAEQPEHPLFLLRDSRDSHQLHPSISLGFTVEGNFIENRLRMSAAEKPGSFSGQERMLRIDQLIFLEPSEDSPVRRRRFPGS